MPPKRKPTPPKRRQIRHSKNRQSPTKHAMTGGSAESNSGSGDVCSADINRLLIGNPPIIYKSGQDSSFSKMAGGLSKSGDEFKKQFSGSIGSNPGKPPALPDGCTIL
jgi:hypothetical protein